MFNHLNKKRHNNIIAMSLIIQVIKETAKKNKLALLHSTFSCVSCFCLFFPLNSYVSIMLYCLIEGN